MKGSGGVILKKILLTLLLFMLAGCNNTSEEHNNNQPDSTSSVNQNEQEEKDSSDNTEELRYQIQEMGDVLREVEMVIVNTAELGKDDADIKEFEDALVFLKKSHEEYLKIKVVNEPEESLDLYMIGIDLIDAARSNLRSRMYYLKTGNSSSLDESVESIKLFRSTSKDFSDNLMRLHKTYLE